MCGILRTEPMWQLDLSVQQYPTGLSCTLCATQERLPELKRLRQEVIKSSRAASRSSRHYKDRAGMATEVDEQSGAIVPFRGGGDGGGGIRYGGMQDG